MRLYVWTNRYISSIQKGIQTAHLVSDLMIKYLHPEATTDYWTRKAKGTLLEWACSHKTIIVLDGGNCEALLGVCRVLNDRNPYPWTSFSEDKESLNEALTVVGVVIPEGIYSRPERKDFETHREFQRAWKAWSFRENPKEIGYAIAGLIEKSHLAI